VAEICLEGSGIAPLVGQGKATGVPQHVRMRLELEASRLPNAFYRSRKKRTVGKRLCGGGRAAGRGDTSVPRFASPCFGSIANVKRAADANVDSAALGPISKSGQEGT
jgi:hypothetical protein